MPGIDFTDAALPTANSVTGGFAIDITDERQLALLRGGLDASGHGDSELAVALDHFLSADAATSESVRKRYRSALEGALYRLPPEVRRAAVARIQRGWKFQPRPVRRFAATAADFLRDPSFAKDFRMAVAYGIYDFLMAPDVVATDKALFIMQYRAHPDGTGFTHRLPDSLVEKLDREALEHWSSFFTKRLTEAKTAFALSAAPEMRAAKLSQSRDSIDPSVLERILQKTGFGWDKVRWAINHLPLHCQKRVLGKLKTTDDFVALTQEDLEVLAAGREFFVLEGRYKHNINIIQNPQVAGLENAFHDFPGRFGIVFQRQISPNGETRFFITDMKGKYAASLVVAMRRSRDVLIVGKAFTKAFSGQFSTEKDLEKMTVEILTRLGHGLQRFNLVGSFHNNSLLGFNVKTCSLTPTQLKDYFEIGIHVEERGGQTSFHVSHIKGDRSFRAVNALKKSGSIDVDPELFDAVKRQSVSYLAKPHRFQTRVALRTMKEGELKKITGGRKQFVLVFFRKGEESLVGFDAVSRKKAERVNRNYSKVTVVEKSRGHYVITKYTRPEKTGDVIKDLKATGLFTIKGE